jgi:hypothetical protein
MATFRNITDKFVIVNDELGNTVGFDPGEIRENLSNYFERYTSAFQEHSEDVLLRRTGELNPPGTVPCEGLEGDNIAVRPSDSDQATLGVRGDRPGGFKGTASQYTQAGREEEIPQVFLDPEDNTSLRRQKVVFDVRKERTSSPARRQIDSRKMGLITSLEASGILDLLIKNQVFPLAKLNQGGGTNERSFQPLRFSGSSTFGNVRAREEDVNHPVYGSLLTIGATYAAFGFLTIFDDSTATTELIGFRIDLSDTSFLVLTKQPDAFALTTFVDHTTFIDLGPGPGPLFLEIHLLTSTVTFTRTGGDADDKIAMEIITWIAPSGALFLDFFYEPDEIRGWIDNSAFTNQLFYAGEEGVFQYEDGENPIFYAWGTADDIVP